MTIEYVDERGRGDTGWFVSSAGTIGYVIDGERVSADAYRAYVAAHPEMPKPPEGD